MKDTIGLKVNRKIKVMMLYLTELYPDSDLRLVSVSDKYYEIRYSRNTLDTDALERDIKKLLKIENLKIVSANKYFSYFGFRIDQYSYLAEKGLENLADRIEEELGHLLANLEVKLVDNKPYVRFSYIVDLTNNEKETVKESIERLKKEWTDSQ